MNHFQPSKRKSILIVEDDVVISRRYQSYLAPSMFVEIANSYEEAIRKLKSASYDAVLTDLHLTSSLFDPCQGLDVIRFASNENINVYAMSSNILLEDVSLGCGAKRFIAKPIRSSEELVRMILV